MRILKEEGLSFDDVLLVPQRSTIRSRFNGEIDLSVKLTPKIKLEIPLISAAMDSVTDSKMANKMASLGGLGIIHRFMEDGKYEFDFSCLDLSFPRVVGIGLGEKGINRLRNISIRCTMPEAVHIDVAYAHTPFMVEFIKKIKEEFPNLDIIVGSIATGEGMYELCKAGVDSVRVGVGPGCFAAGTRILMSNGTYKSIEDIKGGDRVINKYGYPVTVKKSWKTGYKKIHKLNNSLFYKHTLVTPDHRYWVGDLSSVSKRTLQSRGYKKVLGTRMKRVNGENRFKWMPIGKADRAVLLLPKTIKFEMPKTFEVNLYKRCGGNWRTGYKYRIDASFGPSYESGYIFGTFLGDGCASTPVYKGSHRGAVTWCFGNGEHHIVDKLAIAIKEVFGKDPKVTYGKSVTKVILYYKPLADFLTAFGKKDKKLLPKKFLVQNREYLKGLLEGLIDGDGSREKDGRLSFCNTSKCLIELFNVCNYMINGYFPNNREKDISHGNLSGINRGEFKKPYFARSIKRPEYRQTEYNQIAKILKVESSAVYCAVYDIEVDCPTHSFIAENAIVHNSMCSTRVATGNGVPQLTALMACRYMADAYQKETGRKVTIICDGGVKSGGDIMKALAAGADAVMSGSLFAGTDEAPGEIVLVDGQECKVYRGMSSVPAQVEWKGSATSIEGEVTYRLCKGPVEHVFKGLVGNMLSGMSYQDARNLEELYENAEFIKISPSGLNESKPHGKHL